MLAGCVHCTRSRAVASIADRTARLTADYPVISDLQQAVFEILGSKRIGVISLTVTFRDHVTIRYDTIVGFNVDSKAEYTAKSSTHSQKLKQNSAPLIQYRLRSVKSVRKE